MAVELQTRPRPSLTEEERQSLLSMMKLLADDTRLRLIETLSHGEQCVCHLTDALGLPQGTVSHHLGILRRAGWVKDRRDPEDYRWTYYSLRIDRIREIEALLGRVLSVEGADRPTRECPYY